VVIHELRIYDAIPGKLPALNDRFANITLGYFEKYGIKSVAYWTEVIGTSNRLTYLLEFEDLAHRDRAWAGFAADKDRLAAFAETEKDGPLVARVENRILRPTPYSPMQ
jgi:hypothetical protein